MTDGPCLALSHESETQHLCLNNFASWVDLQDLSTYAGLLELIGNALYRQGRLAEGHEVKHVAAELRR